jgi:hypothetical protein
MEELLHGGIHLCLLGALPERFTTSLSTPDSELVFTI